MNVASTMISRPCLYTEVRCIHVGDASSHGSSATADDVKTNHGEDHAGSKPLPADCDEEYAEAGDEANDGRCDRVDKGRCQENRPTSDSGG